jgi:hypothetical protein
VPIEALDGVSVIRLAIDDDGDVGALGGRRRDDAVMTILLA